MLESALEEGVRAGEKAGLLFGDRSRVGPFSVFLLLLLLSTEAIKHDLQTPRK